MTKIPIDESGSHQAFNVEVIEDEDLPPIDRQSETYVEAQVKRQGYDSFWSDPCWSDGGSQR